MGGVGSLAWDANTYRPARAVGRNWKNTKRCKFGARLGTQFYNVGTIMVKINKKPAVPRSRHPSSVKLLCISRPRKSIGYISGIFS